MATKIQVRRDTAANWTTAGGTILSAGEMGLETDTGKWKMGDGTRTWAQLTYQFPILTGSAGTVPDGTTLVVDQANDRVGIGTATPAQKLDVVGTAAISGNTTIGGTLSAGATTLSGDLAVNAATNADITTTTSTATVFNTNATTLNIGGAATTVGIGAATGTTTINNATTAISGLMNLTGNLNVNTNKFNVTAASGNTAIAGTLSAGATTLASLGLTTDLAVADGGTGASTASGARTNLGLGSIATQDSSNVSITGGSISGITDLPVADGGTGASTPASARANLELVQNVASSFPGYNTTTQIDIANIPIGQVWSQVFTRPGNNSSNTAVVVNVSAAAGHRCIVFAFGPTPNNTCAIAMWGATFSGSTNYWYVMSTNSISGQGGANVVVDTNPFTAVGLTGNTTAGAMVVIYRMA